MAVGREVEGPKDGRLDGRPGRPADQASEAHGATAGRPRTLGDATGRCVALAAGTLAPFEFDRETTDEVGAAGAGRVVEVGRADEIGRADAGRADAAGTVEGGRRSARADAGPAAARPSGASPRERALAARLGALEGALADERALLARIEGELVATAGALAASEAAAAPSAWAAQRDQQLRELAGRLGRRDAEVTILEIGVAALRGRLRALVEEVRALGDRQGDPSLTAALHAVAARFAERD